MSHSPDPAKVAAWRQRFERYSRSQLSVARFCAAEGVSVPTFYFWRKKLAEHSSGKAHRAKAGQPAFQPVTVMPAASLVSIRLSRGALIEIPSDNLEMVRTVVREALCTDHALCDGETPC